MQTLNFCIFTLFEYTVGYCVSSVLSDNAIALCWFLLQKVCPQYSRPTTSKPIQLQTGPSALSH